MSHTKEQIKALAEQFICHSASRSIDEVEIAGGIMIELLASETNLRQQKSHLIDEIACQKSNVAYVSKQRDELLSALYLALPFVEDHEGDPCYKAGVVAKTVLTIKAVIASVKHNHAEQPLDMVETTVPAIIFYPAGSLGEAVEP